MEQPGLALDAPDGRLAAWERGARRWARIGAVMLLASVLLPNLWWRSVGDGSGEPGGLRVHGFWEDPEKVMDYRMAPVLPRETPFGLAYWTVLAAFAWRLSVRSSLLRCGVLWTTATVLVGQVAAREHWISGAEGLIPWPLHWPLLGFACAALGLALARTRASPAVGRGVCLYGGLYALGTVFFSPDGDLHRFHDWYEEVTVGRNVNEVGYAVFTLTWIGLGAMLLAVGAARTPRRWWVAAGGFALLATLLVALVSDYVNWGLNVPRGESVPWGARISSVYVHLRLWLRPYGALVLLIAGLFAWIVGARRLPIPNASADARHPAGGV